MTIDFTIDDQNAGAQGSGGALADVGSITVNITPVNDLPTATDNTNTVSEDVSPVVTGNLLTDNDGFGVDSDPDVADVLTVSEIDGVNDPAIDVTGLYGTLDWAADGSYSYTLDNSHPLIDVLDDGESLTESFTYILSDGNGGTDAAVLTITILGTNDGPIAVDDFDTVTEDLAPNPVTGNVLPNDSDPDDEPLTVTLVDGLAANVGAPMATSFGTLTLNSDGSYSYTLDNSNPVVDALGDSDSLSETFSYTISDGDLTATAILTISILGRNEAPVAVDDTNTIAEDSVPAVTGDVLLNDSDPEFDPLTVSNVDGLPANVGSAVAGIYGSLTLNSDGTYSYTLDNADPDTNALPDGALVSETFSYTIQDPSGASDTATLTIDISGANDTPLTINPADQIDPMHSPVTPIDGSLLVTDVDTGDSVTFSDGGTLPLGLVIDPITGLITGTPTVPGSYPVTITVTDTVGATNTIDFNWDVTNTPPIANPNTNSVVEDSGTPTISGDLRANDTDAEDPTSALVITNVNGVPAPGSVTGTYGTITFNSDGTYSYTLDDLDPDTDALPEGFLASETFTYQVRDTGGATSVGNLTINITGANDVPNAIDDTLITDEDTPAVGDVSTNDIEVDAGDTLTVIELNGDAAVIGTAVTLPSGAIVTLNSDGTYLYDPNGAFDGLTPAATAIDSFTYTITDSLGQTSTATVNVTITGVNDAPVAVDDAATTIEETPVVIDVLANDSDPEAEPLVVAIATPPTHGNAVVLPDGIIEYTPDPGFIGNDRFDYTITDPNGGTSTATVDIVVQNGFIYSFDSFNNFLQFQDEYDTNGRSEVLLSQLIPTLAPEPILAGYAKPGTVLVGRLYNVDGSVMAETTTTVDQAGNWVMQFFGANNAGNIRDHRACGNRSGSDGRVEFPFDTGYLSFDAAQRIA